MACVIQDRMLFGTEHTFNIMCLTFIFLLAKIYLTKKSMGPVDIKNLSIIIYVLHAKQSVINQIVYLHLFIW